MKLYRAVLVLAMVFPVGCQLPTAPTPAPLPPIVITNTNTNTNTQAGTPGTTGTPAPGGAIVFIRTGFFGGTCPAGAGEVRNGQPIKIGCIGHATATPLGAGDVKLGPEVHGYECKWTVDNPQVVKLLDVGDNPFNIDVQMLSAGTAHVTATVRGMTGSFDVTVVQ